MRGGGAGGGCDTFDRESSGSFLHGIDGVLDLHEFACTRKCQCEVGRGRAQFMCERSRWLHAPEGEKVVSEKLYAESPISANHCETRLSGVGAGNGRRVRSGTRTQVQHKRTTRGRGVPSKALLSRLVLAPRL